MITLISKDNYNFLINEKTGKWLAFLYKKEDEVIRNITNKRIKELFTNYEEFKEELKVVKNSEEVKNTKLNKMNYLVLHSSDACNMHCKYCYADDNLCDQESNLMDSKVMIQAINKFYKDEDFFVLFHGREPLTNYENIIKTLEHYKNNSKIHFILQTNGTLLDDEKISTLKRYNTIINVSVDGITDNNNIFRINGSKIDYTNRIKKLIEKYKFGPIMIIHKKNYKDLVKITDYFINNNICGASYNFLWPTKENKSLNKYVISCEDLFNTMKKVFDMSIKDNKFIFKERELYLLYGRILKRDIYNYMCNSAPCGAGRNCLSVYKDGQVYPCTMVNAQRDNYLGSLNDSIEEIMNRKVVLKERDIKKIKDCKMCPLRLYCKGGGCSGFIYNLTGDVNGKSLYCEYYYNIILYIMKKIYLMSEKKYFVNY